MKINTLSHRARSSLLCSHLPSFVAPKHANQPSESCSETPESTEQVNGLVSGRRSSSSLLPGQSNTDSGDVVVGDEQNAGFFKGRLNPHYCRNIAGHGATAIFNAPDCGCAYTRSL